MTGSIFAKLYGGTLKGVLDEQRFAELAKKTGSANTVWHAVVFTTPGTGGKKTMTAAELSPMEAEQLLTSSAESVAKLNMISSSFPYTYYAETAEGTLIKLYHPKECSGACGIGGMSVVPWIILSTVKPDESDLERLKPAETHEKNEQGFFSKLKSLI